MRAKNQPPASFSVVIATYQEYQNLLTLLPWVCAVLRTHNLQFEIVIVDDNSQDGTAELIQLLQTKNCPVRLLTRTNERGLASALKFGTDRAKYPNIIRMDADWSHRPTDLPQLLTAYFACDQKCLVIGSRFLPDSNYFGKPPLNQFFSWLGRQLSRLLLGLPYRELSNDFRIFPKKDWQKIAQHLTIDGNTLLIQEVLNFHLIKLPIVEVPITFKERQYGQSKLNLLRETRRFFGALPTLLKNRYLI